MYKDKKSIIRLLSSQARKTRSTLAVPDLGGQGLQEGGQRLYAEVPPVTMAHRHGASFGLAVPDHQHVGDLGQLGVPDLGLEALIAQVQVGAQAQGLGLRRCLSGEGVGAVRDG